MASFNSKSSVKDWQGLTNAASKGFSSNTLQRGRTVTPFSKFRETIKESHEVWAKERENLNAEIKKVNERFLPSVANPMIQELRAKYAEKRADAVNHLIKALDAVVDEHRSAVNDYAMKPCPSDVLALLQGYSMRNNNISVNELKMLLERTGNGYQGLCIAKDICEKNGFTFAAPLSIDEYLDDLNVLQERTAKVIKDSIDAPYENYNVLAQHFFGEYGGQDAFSIDYRSMDERTDLMTGTVPGLIDTLQRIAEAAREEVAEKKGIDLAAAREAAQVQHKVQNFIDKNKDDMLTDEERREFAQAEAVELVNDVLG